MTLRAIRDLEVNVVHFHQATLADNIHPVTRVLDRRQDVNHQPACRRDSFSTRLVALPDEANA